ncbi:MAG: hypothetical protein IKU26_00950 [Clostridia bacterium]|nr:hypothetical protein [Clostridia bacterium]
MFYNQMLKEQQRILREIREKEDCIARLPAGKLCCARNGKWEKWYQLVDGKRIYIPKSNQLHAARLAYKHYLIAETQELQQKLEAVEIYLQKYPQKSPAQELVESPAYQPLLRFFLRPEDQALQKWTQAPFDQNPYRTENKVHRVSSNLSVRSKSEAMIASRLQIHRIPFRYECVLYINGRPLYPDFTIRHPQTGETYYWEHLGLLEDPAYSQRAGEKIALYAKGGIYINRNLILTDETRSIPLSISEIDRTISDYFLCA